MTWALVRGSGPALMAGLVARSLNVNPSSILRAARSMLEGFTFNDLATRPAMSAGPDPRTNAQVIEQERRRLSQRLDAVARLCHGTRPPHHVYVEMLHAA